MTTENPGVLIVAAEDSSALYAKRLLEHWNKNGIKVDAFGIGNREMEALGFEVLGRAEDLAVFGLIEVLKHYCKIRKAFHSILEQAKKRQPKVILLLDYPGFNLRLAEKLKFLGIPIVYYISPKIWAWKKNRIYKIKRLIDKMLVLLPFEKKFYKNHDVDVTFVGHPLLDELNPQLYDADFQAQLKSRFGVKKDDVLIGLMPGSRNSELKYNLPNQIKAAEILHTKYPHLKFALFVAPSFDRDRMQKILPRYSFPLVIAQDDPMKMVSMADYVICTSGTATLVVGLLRKPMVIMYKMNWFTAWVAKKVVKGIKFFGLVNLIHNKEVIKELYQNEASGENIAKEISRFINEPDYKNKTIEKLTELTSMLGDKGATGKVAAVIDPYLYQK